LSYVGSTRLWTLYYHRHTGRRERYPLLDPATRIDPLLDELGHDPICGFWLRARVPIAADNALGC
jgi:hypothetical protein